MRMTQIILCLEFNFSCSCARGVTFHARAALPPRCALLHDLPRILLRAGGGIPARSSYGILSNVRHVKRQRQEE